MKSKRKVLYVCHNHPIVRPGGSETYALELYEAMRASDEFAPILLAKGGPPMSNIRQPHEGTLLATVAGDPDEYFLYTDGSDFDWFHGTSRNKEVFTKHFNELLLAYEPDIVHFQHTLFMGYDLIRQTRNTLPKARIVYTLHEYLPICYNHGQMIRPNNQELCYASSPSRCHECFPDISPQAFFRRQRLIQSHFRLIDLFLSPSQFLMERYIQWGIPREKIRYEANGRRTIPRVDERTEERPRNRLGFFGQFSLYKGVNVLLRAMHILSQERVGLRVPSAAARGGRRMPPTTLADRAAPLEPDTHLWLSLAPLLRAAEVVEGAPIEPDMHLWLYGANLELQPGTFQNEFRALLDAAKDCVTLGGRYSPADVPHLMAGVDWIVLPSIWWENSPLVIQEAFQLGRPVICSDIGGMAEKVTHGVNGLHFRAGDASSLAHTIRYAVDSPGLWDTLRQGIPEVYRIEEHVASLVNIYRSLLDHRSATSRR